jgi:hypothetical protein
MRPEMLARLRAIMRGEDTQNAMRTGGTLEPSPFLPFIQTRSNTAFQQGGQISLSEFSGVLTVPTVPTLFCSQKNIGANDDVSASEPASEPRPVGCALLPDDEEVPDTNTAFWQGVADQRNRASRRGGTDRYCRCSCLAESEWFDLDFERRVWICDD